MLDEKGGERAELKRLVRETDTGGRDSRNGGKDGGRGFGSYGYRGRKA